MLEKWKLLLEWMPLLAGLQEIAHAKEGQDRAKEVAKLGIWLATKTHNQVDDQLANLIHDIILTDEGGALVNYIADKINEVENES